LRLSYEKYIKFGVVLADISWKDWIEKLLASVDIVQIISRSIPLARKGRTWWACCPFHHEKTPSFAVNESEQFYHCFGCGKSGNAISFVAEFERVERIEAIKILAEGAGMKLPQTARNDVDAQKITEKKAKRDEIIRINKLAAGFYHKCLIAGNNTGFDYLINRGITREIMVRFGMGYSPDYHALIRFMAEQGVGADKLREAGLAEGSARDAFGGRVIVPIINIMSEVVGFGGRALEADASAKYKNTAAGQVFDKSRTLFGANIVKKRKQKEGINSVILCEGYMDVISLHACGFDTAVACMGTSLTAEQAKLVKRLADTVYVSFDGDDAGVKATLRSLSILESAGLEVKVIAIPDGLDPDDIVRKRGRAEYEKLIKNAVFPTDYKLKLAESGKNLSASDGKSAFAQTAVKIIAELDSPVAREEYLRKIAAKTGYTLESLKGELDGAVTGDGVKRVFQEEIKPDSALDKAVKYLVSAYLNGKSESADEAMYFVGDDFLREIVLRKKVNPALKARDFLEDIAEESRAAFLDIFEFCDTVGHSDDTYKSRLRFCKKERLKREIDRLAAAAAAEADKQKRGEILVKIQQYEKEIRRS